MRKEFKELSISFKSYSRTGKKGDEVSAICCVTDAGEIEESEWKLRMLDLIEKYNETDILESLKRYHENEFEWLKYSRFKPGMEEGKEKREEYDKLIEQSALSSHALRLFEDESWKGKELFEKEYLNKSQDKQLTLM